MRRFSWLFLLVSIFLITIGGCKTETSNLPLPDHSVVQTDKTNIDSLRQERDTSELKKPYLETLQSMVPFDGKPILLDLGSDSCVPCLEMVPVLEDLKQNYSNSFHTAFVNVRENQKASSEFGVQFIPTQIFFDGEGNEKYRHVGFFSKEEILNTWLENGYEFSAN